MGTQHVPCFAQESVVLVGPADTGLMSSGRRTLGELRLRMTEEGGGLSRQPLAERTRAWSLHWELGGSFGEGRVWPAPP